MQRVGYGQRLPICSRKCYLHILNCFRMIHKFHLHFHKKKKIWLNGRHPLVFLSDLNLGNFIVRALTTCTELESASSRVHLPFFLLLFLPFLPPSFELIPCVVPCHIPSFFPSLPPSLSPFSP